MVFVVPGVIATSTITECSKLTPTQKKGPWDPRITPSVVKGQEAEEVRFRGDGGGREGERGCWEGG